MSKKQLFLLFFFSSLLTSVQQISEEEETNMNCLQTASGKKISPFDVMLPTGLVLKRSDLSQAASTPQDEDFHIGMLESDVALMWVAQNDKSNGDYLCGALLPLDQQTSQKESFYDRLISILSSPYKMISEWIWHGDDDLLSSAKTSDFHWEKVALTPPHEKWYVCGVHKKQDVPVKYYIRKQNQKVWVTKEEAFELALSGLLEIVVPPTSNE